MLHWILLSIGRNFQIKNCQVLSSCFQCVQWYVDSLPSIPPPLYCSFVRVKSSRCLFHAIISLLSSVIILRVLSYCNILSTYWFHSHYFVVLSTSKSACEVISSRSLLHSIVNSSCHTWNKLKPKSCVWTLKGISNFMPSWFPTNWRGPDYFFGEAQKVKEQHGGLHKCNGSERTDHKPDGN